MKIQLLQRAIELDAANPYALANLGGELFGVDDRRALELLEKALEHHGNRLNRLKGEFKSLLRINPRLFYARLCISKAWMSCI